MSLSIHIDIETCTRCRKCVRICPAEIFIQETPKSDVETQHISSCIHCGHCVGVCPTSSIVHSDFPAEKIHPIHPEKFPTSEQLLLLIKSRRSNRAFSAKPVPAEKLDLILEAAHRAPTGTNAQNVSFTLVTDPEKIQQVIGFTIDIFMELGKKLSNPFLKPILKLIVPDAYAYLPHLEALRRKYEMGQDPILRKATALLLIHTPKKSQLGCQDANLAYQNGSLMAESLGISQFYTGFLCIAMQQDKKNRIPNFLGIEGKVHAGMGLGVPSIHFENYIDRKEIDVRKL
ncbi:nitroreductase family protein [Parabacteroides sp. PF5-9]|uniref:nitroreductase family protein n=1 Tax=Parabacteroides sp. PF5-9 TaxID=1742404 RepID=UPI002473988E|nr:nitroreductase family protein [Parabacteroides sp. PF5-9]MDH6357922.1 nitroreductase/NAD-dependent dihydropyrimidine dehydrogenase PreA subunit [Parabacteroides sp. PF5-9]